MKPTRAELSNALQVLLVWATGMDRDKNPYSYKEVKAACVVMAREQVRGDCAGPDWSAWRRDWPLKRIKLGRMMYAGEAEERSQEQMPWVRAYVMPRKGAKR